MPEEPTLAVFTESEPILESLRRSGFQPVKFKQVDADKIRRSADTSRAAIVDGRELPKDRILRIASALAEQMPLLDVVVWVPGASGRLVRDLFRLGVKDVATGSKVDVCVESVRHIVESQTILPSADRSNERSGRKSQFERIWSRSRAMWDIFDLVARVAPSDATVLIIGETGTGKELLARAVHRRSERHGRFVTANCSSISPELIDSELFGHEKGAFTGATGSKTGLARHAEEGTLFLDEIGDMPPQSQLSLLRMLQEKRVRPVGGQDEIPVNVRVVAATHVPLEEAVEDGSFREDLFYRLDVIRLTIPPLRERPEDIPFLFGHFLRRLARHYGTEVPHLSESFLASLVSHEWPGNVRQLENLAERILLSTGRKRLRAADFAEWMEIESEPVGDTSRSSEIAEPLARRVDLEKTLADNVEPVAERLERAYLVAALQANRGRINETAKTAGLSRRTLLRKLNFHGIDKADFKQKGNLSLP